MNTNQPSPKPKITTEDALLYLDQVKYTFGSQSEDYTEFLNIMKDFKLKKLDTPGVILKVATLFKDHPELMVDFNLFLPEGFKIVVESDSSGEGYVFVCKHTQSDFNSMVSTSQTVDCSAESNAASFADEDTSFMSSVGALLTSVTSLLSTLPSMVSGRFYSQE